MRLEYEFLRMGASVEPRRRYIYLDIGNQSRPGIVDTHASGFDQHNFECSSSLIVAKPSLITDWITADDMEHPITLVMHENPDYDCIASSFLVRRLLEARSQGRVLPDQWTAWAPMVARAARRVDRGETRLHIAEAQPPITPYLSLIALHEAVSREALDAKNRWRTVVDRGQQILQRALDLARKRGITDLELTDLRGSLSDFGDLEAIIDQKLRAFRNDAARIGLSGTSSATGAINRLIDLHLPLRGRAVGSAGARMAVIRDPECGPAFFKSIMRGTYGDSIGATCVFQTIPADRAAATPQWVRPIISVDPDCRFDLRGLGRHLDLVETEARRRKGVPRVGRPRPGFDNSDPWYDGRAFGYSIIDAPRWGTILAPEQVLEEVQRTDRWMNVRVGEVVAESLQAARFAQPAKRQPHFGILAQAVAYWAGNVPEHDARLYTECVDAISSLVTAADRPTYAPLLDAADDVVLALFTNDDAAVRTDALYAAAQRTDRITAHAESCRREDVLPLLIVAGGAPDAAARLLMPGGGRWQSELLVDAAAARLGLLGPDEVVLRAVAAFTSHNVHDPRVASSARNLYFLLNERHPELAHLLEPAAAIVPLSPQRPAADAIQRWRGRLRAVGADTTPGVADFRRWLRGGNLSRAADMLVGLMTADPAADDRPLVLDLANNLLESLADQHDPDETTVAAARMLLSRLQATWTAPAAVDALSPKALAEALQISPELVGRLIRAWSFSPNVRWQLVSAAVNADWRPALGQARRYIVTAENGRIYRQAQALTTATAALRAAEATPPNAGPQHLAFLLLVAEEARGARGERVHELLRDVAVSDDLLSIADRLTELRELIGAELRQRVPDYNLLTDIELSLLSTETFCRAIMMIGPDQSMSGAAATLLFHIAISLPQVRFDLITELATLAQRPRFDGRSELDQVARCAFDFAAAMGSITHHDALVTDAKRLRAAAAAIETSMTNCPATPVGWLTSLAMRSLARMLRVYAETVEAATDRHDESLDDPALRMLLMSTMARAAADYRESGGGESGALVVRVAARLASRASERPDDVRKSFSRFRTEMGRAATLQAGYRAAEKRLLGGAEVAQADPAAVDRLYSRIGELHAIPVNAVDDAHVKLVDTLITRYDIRRARRRIDEYSFGRIASFLRFWMSGWTALIPLFFIGLFISAGHDAPPKIRGAIGLGVIAVVCMAVTTLVMEWRKKRRASHSIQSLRYKLFLPKYVVPVLIGVYTAAMTEEITAHMAMQLDEGRYILVALLLFGAAAWALRQVIRRDGGTASLRNVLSASGRLFGYGFLIAVVLSMALGPLLGYDVWLHKRRTAWINEPAWSQQASPRVHHHEPEVLPEIIPMTHHPVEIALFPRHIILNALFGMFIGIFLRGFWKVSELE